MQFLSSEKELLSIDDFNMPPKKFIPAIGLLKCPGVGEGRNFTTVTVIGLDNLTPYGRGGC